MLRTYRSRINRASSQSVQLASPFSNVQDTLDVPVADSWSPRIAQPSLVCTVTSHFQALILGHVNRIPVRCLIDTGSAIKTVCAEKWVSLFGVQTLAQGSTKAVGVSGQHFWFLK